MTKPATPLPEPCEAHASGPSGAGGSACTPTPQSDAERGGSGGRIVITCLHCPEHIALIEQQEREIARIEAWARSCFEAGFQERQRAERAEAEVERLRGLLRKVVTEGMLRADINAALAQKDDK